MARSLIVILIACGVLLPTADRAAAPDDLVGARLATLCAPCHRLDGRNTGISSVTRWEAEEIVDKMRTFRSDERSNNAMRAVSRSLSDDEIATVAEYLAALGKKAKTP